MLRFASRHMSFDEKMNFFFRHFFIGFDSNESLIWRVAWATDRDFSPVFYFWHHLDTEKYVFFEKNPKIAYFPLFSYKNDYFWIFLKKFVILSVQTMPKLERTGFFTYLEHLFLVFLRFL